MIAIVDYGVGNLFSLQSSLQAIGAQCVVTGSRQALDEANSIILPGVGAFGDAVQQLRGGGLDQILCEQVKKGKPLLGICLGMQLLYEASEEYGRHSGLGLVKGKVLSLAGALGENSALKVPHMGWNDLRFQKECPLLRDSREGEFVYYVHSFYAPVTNQTAAFSTYGIVQVTGVVQNGNVFGTQFHPEKSGEAGLRMLAAFAEFRG